MAYKREDLNVEALERLMKGAGKKFVSLEEGAALMSLGRNNFREIAKDAKAIYKIKRRVLINMDKIYEFMEAFVEEDWR